MPRLCLVASSVSQVKNTKVPTERQIGYALFNSKLLIYKTKINLTISNVQIIISGTIIIFGRGGMGCSGWCENPVSLPLRYFYLLLQELLNNQSPAGKT